MVTTPLICLFSWCKKGCFLKIHTVESGNLDKRAVSASLWSRLNIGLTFAEFTGLLESEHLHKEIYLWLWQERIVCSRSWFDLLSSPSFQSSSWLFVEGGKSFLCLRKVSLCGQFFLVAKLQLSGYVRCLIYIFMCIAIVICLPLVLTFACSNFPQKHCIHTSVWHFLWYYSTIGIYPLQ